MRTNTRFFFALLLLAGCGLMANVAAQSILPPNIGPLTFTLNGSSGTFAVPNLNGQSYCTVTVPSTATMGSGTITLKTSADNGANWFGVTGLPDLGSGASASQTITIAGTQLTAPVSGKTGFELVLSGATGAVITGSVTCALGSGATGSNSSGGSGGATPIPTPAGGIYPVTQASVPWSVACLAVYPCGFPTPIPTTNPLPVTTPAPATTASPGGGITTQRVLLGNGSNTYLDSIPDPASQQSPVPFTVPTTVPVVVGSTTANTYIFGLYANATGVNTSVNAKLTTGQGATCGTNTQTWFAVVVIPATAGQTLGLWGNGTSSGATGAITAPWPLILPANATVYNACLTTTGATENFTVFNVLAQHVGYFNPGDLERIEDALGYVQRTDPWLLRHIAYAVR